MGGLSSVSLAVLLIAGAPGSVGPPDQQQAPPLAQRVGPEAVWTPSKEVLLRIGRECGGRGAGCLPAVMRRSGASEQAVAFAAALYGEGYLGSFQKLGRVDLAIVVYPFRANDNEAPALVNGRPSFVDVMSVAAALSLSGDPHFSSIAKTHPNVGWQGDVPRFEEMRPLPQGGQRFVFSFLLQDGCHACASLGKAWFAMDFDGTGAFQKPVLLGSTDPAPTQPPQPAVQRGPQGVAPAKPVPPDRLITNASIGPVRLCMTIAEARGALRGFEVVRGTWLDGAVVYTVRRGSQTVMRLVPMAPHPWDPITEQTRIHDIRVVDPSYATAGGVHPGMSVPEVARVYGQPVKIQRSEVEAQEFALFPKQPPAMRFQVDVGTGIFAGGEMTTTRYVPAARILGIWVTWKGACPG